MRTRKYKGFHFNADGSYDPAQIAAFIKKHIYNNKATSSEIQEAYPKTMAWIELKKLPFTEKTISDNKDELIVAINDPNFFEKEDAKRRPGILQALIVIGIILVLYYFLFEFNQGGVHQGDPVAVPPAPAPVPSVPAPAPIPAPAPVTPVSVA